MAVRSNSLSPIVFTVFGGAKGRSSAARPIRRLAGSSGRLAGFRAVPPGLGGSRSVTHGPGSLPTIARPCPGRTPRLQSGPGEGPSGLAATADGEPKADGEGMAGLGRLGWA